MSTRSLASSVSTNSSIVENEVAMVEMLLEAYFMNYDNAFNRLQVWGTCACGSCTAGFANEKKGCAWGTPSASIRPDEETQPALFTGSHSFFLH